MVPEAREGGSVAPFEAGFGLFGPVLAPFWWVPPPPVGAAVMHLLRPSNRSRSIYHMEEAPTAPYPRRGVNPSDGRERGVCPPKRPRSISDIEEREAAQLHRPGLTPSDGRERGKKPRRNTDI